MINYSFIMKKVLKFILYKILRLFPRKLLVGYSQSFFDKKDNSFSVKIVRGFLGECYESGTMDIQKDIGFALWRSKAATNYLSKRTIPDSVVEKFANVIINNPGYDVCEIGAGNGYLIEILSKKIPGRKFVGVDLNEDQIINDSQRFEGNNLLKFVCADAVEYVENMIFDKTIFISYISLTTFTPDAVQCLFESISFKKQPSFLVICEANKSGVADAEKSELRGNLAYSHNYITIAKKYNFDIISYSTNQETGLFWLVCQFGRKKFDN